MLYTVNWIEEKKNLEGVRHMKNFKFNKITIKIKLLTIFFILATVPISIVGTFS